MHRPSVSLVIPMYNEELNIEHAVAAAVDSLQKYSDDYEIIIVDDASTDDSPRLAAKLAAENPRIRVITHARNQKLGATLRSGFAATTKELIFYMDADRSEEHTSELQSRLHLVCRLLLEKKKKQ